MRPSNYKDNDYKDGRESNLQSQRPEPQVKVFADLCRLSRFGANISDAHSCFIFLPSQVLSALSCLNTTNSETTRTLVMAGYHSLSNNVVDECILPRDSGLIGWVAKHGRSIHVSPFELDSRTLGLYTSDQQLKSFIGIPVRISPSDEASAQLWGVIACDSKKSFAFSKIQGKLLDDLAREVSNTIELLLMYGAQGHSDVAWQVFLRRSTELAASLTTQSIQLLRLKLLNFDELEAASGTSQALALVEQLYRLISQALPPHFPVVRLVNGDIVVCLDNMMTAFYENRIRAICEHVAPEGRRPRLDFIRPSLREKRSNVINIDRLVTSTSRGEQTTNTKEFAHGIRRA